jgi:type IV secretion system protein VirB1
MHNKLHFVLFVVALLFYTQSLFAITLNPVAQRAIQQCLPNDYKPYMARIVKIESNGNPFAININGNHKILRQPKTKKEAVYWSTILINKGYSIDMGISQINSQHFKAGGLFAKSSIEAVFDPCANVLMGAYIFGKNYNKYDGSVVMALSAYNTGHPEKGIKNGYVSKVLTSN